MRSIKCCWAGLSENGNTGWDGRAKAGDQTGREVRVDEWYYFGQTEVFRWIDSSYADKYASIIESMCGNDNIGYDQSERYTLNDWLKSHNYDYLNLKTPVECDCSALTLSAINTLFKSQVVSGGVVTATMKDALMKTGYFELLTESKYLNDYMYLKRGDIINAPSNHVITVLEDGPMSADYYVTSIGVEPLREFYVGDSITASDFRITVRMNNGDIKVNPPGWSATPLTVKSITTNMTFRYMNYAVGYILIAKQKIYITSMDVTQLVKYKVGDSIKAQDFKIVVNMSDGAKLVNPAGWTASPLKLSSSKNNITFAYSGYSTVVEVLAEAPTQSVQKPDVTYPTTTRKWCLVTNCNTLNVRVSPSAKDEVLKYYPKLGKGNGVTLIGQNLSGDWAYVLIAEKYYGWVSADYIVDSKTSKRPTNLQSISGPSMIEDKVRTVRCEEPVHVKTSYSNSKPDLVVWPLLGNGNLVRVQGYNSDKTWSYLNIEGCKGWIPSSYLK